MQKSKGISLLILCAFLLPGLVTAQPKLTIPESIFDFGFTPQNSKVSHIFWLHSTGTDSLIIEKVKPG
ncbi:MAG: hypothetical protein JSV44_09940 [Candidatus Zixiibacteriota bacterium]|nr:MAG: hypothetical protein JSV44_09940 [candidate division Zixibacteria bacterium]